MAGSGKREAGGQEGRRAGGQNHPKSSAGLLPASLISSPEQARREVDEEVLREVMGSVYLTPRQRAALGRLLGSVARSPRPAAAVTRPSTTIQEEQRHALLGPCGAE